MYLLCTLFSLDCLTCLHTVYTPLGQNGSFLRSVNTPGEKREILCLSFNHSLSWDEFAMKSGRPEVVLKAEICLDLLRFLSHRPLQICMVYMLINIRHCRTSCHQSKGKQKTGPSVQVLISGYFESPFVYPPQQYIIHWPVWNWNRNGRWVQHSFDGITLFHCYCPKAELPSTNWEAIG